MATTSSLYKRKVQYLAQTIICVFLVTISLGPGYAQEVEIQGKAKISVMDTVNSESMLVVKQPDGTLATRSASTLLPPHPDTVRTLSSDMELAKLLCDCDNNMPPFLVESTLDAGYTASDLLRAGVTAANLVDGGASPADLLAAGASPADLLAAGISIDSMLSLDANPVTMVNSGISVDSLYGRMYKGGLIFFIDTNNVHPFDGLVAAPNDQSGVEQWGCYLVPIGGTSLAVGTGKSNTNLIVPACMDSIFAAKTCYALVLNTYDDWFLPSFHELELMYQNLYLNGLGGFISNAYWSSSEDDADQAWFVNFSNGLLSSEDKSLETWVRAVREF